MLNPTILRFTTLSLLCICIFSSCGNPEESKTRHLQQGKKYLEEENYDKARVEFKNVLQIDPNSAESYSLLGQIEEYNQNWRKAISYYNKAIELNPALIQPHLKLGYFYLQQAAGARAMENLEKESSYIEYINEHIKAVLSNNPQHIDAIVLEASLKAYLDEDNLMIIESLQNALKIDPTHNGAILLLSRIYANNKQYSEIEKFLNDAINRLPENIDIRLELAKFFANQKQYSSAARIMKDIIKLDPDSLGYRLSLASYYLQLHKRNEAEGIYREAIKSKPDDALRYLAYADFIKNQDGLDAAISYLQNNINNNSDSNKEIEFRLALLLQEASNANDAISILQNIINDSKNKLTAIRAKKHLIALYLSRNNIENANKLVNEILAENPNDYDTTLFKAKISISKKNYSSAIESLRTALKNQPNSIEIIQLLADSHLLNGEPHMASDLLKRAVDIAPNDLDTHLKRSRFLLASNEPDQAMNEINYALKIEPANIDALLLKSDILMRKNQIQQVVSLLTHLKEIAPDNPEGWFRMGRIYKQMNKNNDARKEFMSAFDRAPDSIDLLAELTDIEIGLGEIDSTKNRLQKIITNQPEHIAAHKFLGMVYLVEKNFENAEKEFLLHLDRSPKDIATYIQLAEMHYKLKNYNQAAKYYLAGRGQQPDNTNILRGLAQIRTIQKNYADAIKLHEEVLTIEPNNAVTINNLAILLANNTDSSGLKTAENLIKNAKAKNHPALQDTLGWIYYLQGDYINAINSLERVIQQARSFPTLHYHLGKAYMKNGNNNKAEKQFTAALNLGDFPEREDAIQSLKLVKSTSIPIK